MARMIYKYMIPPIETIAGQQPSYPSISSVDLPQLPRIQTPYYWKSTPFVPYESPNMDYNDPDQLNSIADVILRSFSSDDPVMDFFRNMKQYTYQSTIKPLLSDSNNDGKRDWNWGAVDINALINFSETMDIVANPVKALAQGYGWEGVKNAVGWGGQGRINYDYQTGNLASDLMLEVVSDPLNWITLGTKAIGTAVAKSAVKDITSKAVAEAGLSLSDDAARVITKRAIKAYIGKDAQSLTSALNDAFQHYSTRNMAQISLPDLAKQIFESAPDIGERASIDMAEEIQKQYLKKGASSLQEAADTAFGQQNRVNSLVLSGALQLNRTEYMTKMFKALETIEGVAQDTMSFRVVKGLTGISAANDSINRLLLKAAVTPTIYPGWWLAKKGYTETAKFIKNNLDTTMRPFLKQDGTYSFVDFSAIKQLAAAKYEEARQLLESDGDLVDLPLEDTVMFYRGVEKDVQYISGLFNKYPRDYEKFMEELTLYLQEKHSVNNLEEYLEFIKKANVETNGRFQFAETLYSEFLRHMEAFRTSARARQLAQYANDAQDATNNAQETFHMWFSNRIGNNIEDSEYWADHIMDKFLEYTEDQVKAGDPIPLLYMYYSDVILPLMMDAFYGLMEQIPVEFRGSIIKSFEDELGIWTDKVYDSIFAYVKSQAEAYPKYLNDYKGPTLEWFFPKTLKTFEDVELALGDAKASYNEIAEEFAFDLDYLKLFAKPENVMAGNKVADKIYSNFRREVMGKAKEMPHTAARNVKQLRKQITAAFRLRNEKDINTLYDVCHTLNMDNSVANDIFDFLNADAHDIATLSFHYDQVYYTLKSYQTYLVKSDVVVIHPDLLDSIFNLMDEIKPHTISAQYLTYSKEIEYVQLKRENFNATMSLIASGDIGALLQRIRTGEGFLGTYIKNNAELLNNKEPGAISTDALARAAACHNIQQIVLQNQMYLELVNNLALDRTLSQKARTAFNSSLQHFAKTNPNDFYTHADKIDDLFKYINDNIYFMNSKQKYNLETLRNKYGIPQEGAHGAVKDTKDLKEIIKQELPELFDDPRFVGKKIWIGDIESNTSTGYSGEILELTRVGWEDSAVVSNKQIGIEGHINALIPNPDILNVFYPGKSYEDQLKLFRKDYTTTNPEAIISERKLLQAYFEGIDADTVLVFHNGAAFDIPFILARLQVHGMKEESGLLKWMIDNGQVIDTFLEMKAKEDVVLTLAEQTALRGHFETYLKNLTDNHMSGMVNNRTYELITEMLYLIKDYEDMIKTKGTGSDLENLRELRNAKDMLNEGLKTIRDTNKALGTNLVANVTKMGADDLRKETIPVLREMLGMSDEAFAKKFGDDPNVRDMLSDVLGMTRAQFDETFGDQISLPRILSYGTESPEFAFRNAISGAEISKYFNLIEGSKYAMWELKTYTTIAKSLVKQASYIRNPFLIQKYRVELRETFNQLMQEIPASHGYLKNLRLDLEDDISLYVMTRYLYKNLRGTSPLIFRPEIVTMFEDPVVVRSITHYGDIHTTSEMIEKKLLENEFHNQVSIHAINQNFKTQVINLRGVSAQYDEFFSRGYRSESLAVANAMEHMSDILDMFEAMSPTNRSKLIKNMHTEFNHLSRQQLWGLLARSISEPEHLKSVLVWESPVIEFTTHIEKGSLEFKALLKSFTESVEQLGEDSFVKVIEKNNRMYIVLNAKKYTRSADVIQTKKGKFKYQFYLNGEEIARPLHEELQISSRYENVRYNREHNSVLFEDMSLGSADFNLHEKLTLVRGNLHSLSDNRSVGSLGDLFTPGKAEDLWKQYPDEVKELLGSQDVVSNDMFFKGVKYNWANIGTVESRRYVDEFVPNNLLSLYKTSLQYTAALAESKKLYIQTYFDSQMNINVGWLKDASNEDVMKALKGSDEFVLTALIESKKYPLGCKVVRIEPNSPQAIEEARRLNAIILPYATFATAYSTINANRFSSTFLNIWSKLIYTYKVGYLLDPGVICRNAVDSTLKAIINTGDPWGTLKAEKHAMMLLSNHSDLFNKITMMDPHGRFLESKKVLYFSTHPNTKITEDMFDFTHGFMIDGSSAGLSGDVKKYFQTKMLVKDSVQLPDGSIQDRYNQVLAENEMGAWQTFTYYADWAMTPNRYVEQVNRLAQYLVLEQQGFTRTKAFSEIAKTHFDLTVKTEWEELMELIFPFYTFKMRNLEFWVNAMCEKPWLASLFRDVVSPVWNFDGISQEELQYNQSLQYQILNGNMPLGDAGMTLKLNPSFMDAFNILTSPMENILMSSAQPLQIPLANMLRDYGGAASGLFDLYPNRLGNESWSSTLQEMATSLVPVLGPVAQRYGQLGPKYADRLSGHPEQQMLARTLPGVFGATKSYKPKTYQKKAKKNKNKAFWRYYPRNTRNYRVYAKNYYPNHWQRFDEYESFYAKHYSKKGNSKMKMRGIPYTAGNLQYRIKDMYYYWK